MYSFVNNLAKYICFLIKTAPAFKLFEEDLLHMHFVILGLQTDVYNIYVTVTVRTLFILIDRTF